MASPLGVEVDEQYPAADLGQGCSELRPRLASAAPLLRVGGECGRIRCENPAFNAKPGCGLVARMKSGAVALLLAGQGSFHCYSDPVTGSFVGHSSSRRRSVSSSLGL